MRSNWVSAVALAGFVSFGVFACSSDDAGAPATATDAGVDGSTVPRVDAGTPDAGPVEGASCANAIAAELGVEIDGNIDAEGKKVFYAINVKAGDFLLIGASTAATPDTGEEIVDTAVTVFDAAGTTMLANLDDAFPRYTTDAELYYRAPADATLCVRVTDYATWAGDASTVATDNAFKFFAGKIDPTAAVVTFDTGANDTDAAPQTGKLKAYTQSPGGYTYLVGTLSSASDVDTYAFTVPTGAKAISVAVPPIGAPLAAASSSYGSTMERFVVTVKKTDGTVVAELAPPSGAAASMSDGLSAPVEAGTYLVTIARPTGAAAGANDFYATTLAFGSTNTPETETVGANTNDTLATAQSLTLATDTTNAKRKEGFVLGYLPAGDLADTFAFPVAANDKVTVSCAAVRNGSGLEGMKVELFLDGASKQTETEVATKDLVWSDSRGASKPAVTAAAAGTAAVQITTTGRSSRVAGTFYLCGFHTTAP
jgi:hypothetical protein